MAGYGTGTRLEYLLVPLVFGLGAPLAALVGTAIGAGDRERARRAAWIGAALAGLASEAIGVAAALSPEAWLGLFGDDPAMLAVGTRYLQMVGPLYGFFGFGLALYFAAQGAGRVGWALAAGLLRVILRRRRLARPVLRPRARRRVPGPRPRPRRSRPDQRGRPPERGLASRRAAVAARRGRPPARRPGRS